MSHGIGRPGGLLQTNGFMDLLSCRHCLGKEFGEGQFPTATRQLDHGFMGG
jgi:hypothetical protein